MTHTPEPWVYTTGPVDSVRFHTVYPVNHPAPFGTMICECFEGTEAEQEANARRIVAAINATAGIPTEALEQGVVRELVEALDDITEHYVSLALSGDAGFWDPEEEPEVIAARAALAKAGAQ